MIDNRVALNASHLLALVSWAAWICSTERPISYPRSMIRTPHPGRSADPTTSAVLEMLGMLALSRTVDRNSSIIADRTVSSK